MSRLMTKILMTGKVLLLMAITFYGGYLYGAIRDRLLYESPAGDVTNATLHDRTTAGFVPRTAFAPVALEGGAVPAKRAALRRKIFGTRHSAAAPTLQKLDLATFTSEFIGHAVFDAFYRQVFVDRAIEVSRVRGAFDEIEDYRWTAILLRQSVVPAQGLFLYHHGHDGNPFAFTPPNVVIRAMLERGYDVAVFCMPGVGWNDIGQARLKTWDGWVRLMDSRYEEHDVFAMIDTGEGHFIKFFLEPVIASLNLAMVQRSYSNVVMAGHSGGGWTTTLAAALDPRIDVSLSYAGTLPFFARQRPRDLGDVEQLDPGFYRDFPYPVLYELASAASVKQRVHYQIFNSEDSCCFNGDSAAAFRRYLDARPFQPDRDLRIAIIANKGHYMAADLVLDLIGRSGLAEARR